MGQNWEIRKIKYSYITILESRQYSFNQNTIKAKSIDSKQSSPEKITDTQYDRWDKL